MDEEPDYMSDEFLQACLKSEEKASGLIKSRKEQREHDMLKKKKTVEAEQKAGDGGLTKLEKDLQMPISSENKGFSMLQKMGFKVGMGLGKMNSGITEPIPISVKNDRQGFGRAEALKEIKLRKEKIKARRKEKLTNTDDYRAMVSKKCKEREIASDLRKSQRICHQLDIQAGLDKPEDEWFWPEDSIPKEEEEVEAEDDNFEYEPVEKLDLLTSYLRQTYCYCIWCGVQYDDEKDLQDCPGPGREFH